MSAVMGLPPLSVQVDDRSLDALLLEKLQSMHCRQVMSLPAQCELTFADLDASRQAYLPRPGNNIRVTLHGNQLLFNGEVTAQLYAFGPTQESLTTIRCYDYLHRLRKRRQVTAHVEFNVTELASTLTADTGLTVEAMEAGPPFTQAIQCKQSDFEFLQEYADRSGVCFSVRDKTLFVYSLAGFGEAQSLSFGRNLLQADAQINADPICRGVHISGWDPRTAQTFQSHPSTARSGRRVDAALQADAFATDAEFFMTDCSLQNDQQGEAFAQGRLDWQMAEEIVINGVADGDVGLQPGGKIRVGELAAPLNGEYVLTQVNHIIDHNQGYVSRFSTLPPRAVRPRPQVVSTLARVSRVDDPDGLGRVRVTLSNYAEVETDWCQVVVPGAGDDKGMIALPDVDDEVLVLFINDDPAQAVVLGGLYGQRTVPDSGVDDGARRRFCFTTAQGQRLTLDDVENTIVLENQKGSFVKMTPDTCLIHAATQLIIEAPDNHIIIRGNKIDFNKG